MYDSRPLGSWETYVMSCSHYKFTYLSSTWNVDFVYSGYKFTFDIITLEIWATEYNVVLIFYVNNGNGNEDIIMTTEVHIIIIIF